MKQQLWLIWSIEHGGWWRPASQGYTQLREQAGRYEWMEALAIVRDANMRVGNTPNEALVPE